MRRLRRGLGALILSLALLMQAGCWDLRQIDDRTMVLALGFDAEVSPRASERDEVLFTVQIPILRRVVQGGDGGGGGGGGADEPTFVSMSAQGVTVPEAVLGVQAQINKELFFGHASIYVIGRERASQGIIEIVDHVRRNPQISRAAYVLVADERAQNILQVQPELDRLPAEFIRAQVEHGARIGRAPVVAMSELFVRMHAATEELILPIIRARDETTLEISGSAAFRGDVMVGELDELETRGLLWIRGEMHRNVPLTVPAPGMPGEYVTFLMLRSRTRLSHTVSGDTITMRVDIEGEGDIVDVTRGVRLTQTEIDRIERALEAEARENVIAAWTRAKKLQTDILGFGEHLRQREPRLWRSIAGDWNDLFPRVEMDVEISISVRRTGMVNRP